MLEQPYSNDTSADGGLPCGIDAARADFLDRYGEQYGYNGWLDEHYDEELGCRLRGEFYLDYTGAGQYTNSQIEGVMREMTSCVFGNPHSRNPGSARSTAEVENARKLVLQHFNADPEQYHVVFTKGATEALKMIAEMFPWKGASSSSSSDNTSTSSSSFIYTQANHKSVLGIGAVAKHAGAQLQCLSRDDMDAWLDNPSSSNSSSSEEAGLTAHLVAWPAKCNYEGQLYPMDWVRKVHAKSDSHNKYFVVLDAAAFVPTHPLDLTDVQADFVPISFYKMFGYPSGLGVLLVRKEAAALLHKVYFGGGSVDYCTAEDAWHVLSPLPAGWEDGTLAFLSISGLKFGFQQLQQLGGMQAVAGHVESLRAWGYQQLVQLKHSNGTPLVQLFGRHADGHEHQSGIFQFQVLCLNGCPVPPGVVEQAATAAGLQLRTGCNCNPGKCLPNLGIKPEEERARAATNHRGQLLTVLRPATCKGRSTAHSEDGDMVPMQLPTGSVRVSLGYLSRFEDVYALLEFLNNTFRDEKGAQLVAAAAAEDLEWSAEAYC